ncbi:tubulin-specific chaperone A-like [Haliotis rubra]|uniref:tubulin-specific chaperone A-like n=1 Tax=Haliotis rubra TaxID=36100 RepID=UPI001EE5A3F6|nr:tubulin-specific chaperone A-like [Haliotis rubra]
MCKPGLFLIMVAIPLATVLPHNTVDDRRITKIKIHTRVVKRLTKEKSMYEKEVETLEARVNKLKDDGADEHDIRKQTEVLQESRMMIPDTKKRLKTAYEELEQILQNDSDLSERGEFGQAKDALEAAKAAIA